MKKKRCALCLLALLLVSLFLAACDPKEPGEDPVEGSGPAGNTTAPVTTAVTTTAETDPSGGYWSPKV